MFKKIFALVLALTSIYSFAEPGFSVAPGVLQAHLKQQQTYVFLVKNTGSQLIHLRVRPEFMLVQSKSLSGGKSLIDDKQQKMHSLVPYTIISPQVLSLQPTEQRDVRVSIQVPAHAKPGTYREHLIFKMLEIARHINEKEGSKLGIHLNLLMQIAPVIYADIGHNQAKLQLTCSKDNNGNLLIHALNNTPWHYAGYLEGFASNMKKPIFKVRAPIFSHSTHNIKTPWKVGNKTSVTLNWRNAMLEDAPVNMSVCKIK